jgi:hypothetical protein
MQRGWTDKDIDGYNEAINWEAERANEAEERLEEIEKMLATLDTQLKQARDTNDLTGGLDRAIDLIAPFLSKP